MFYQARPSHSSFALDHYKEEFAVITSNSPKPAHLVRWLGFTISLCVLSIGVWAETAPPSNPSAPPVESTQQRHKLVESSLPLSATEAQAFWPIYDRYQNELYTLMEQRKWLISGLGENYEDIDDESAKKFIYGYTELQETRMKLLKTYLPKFAKALPPKKLVRYYQIETKIRAAVDAEIAERIPLVQ